MHFRKAQAEWTPTDIHLHDDEVRKVLQFPKHGLTAQEQARFSAVALEQDRNSVRYHEVAVIIAGLEGDIRQMQQIVNALKAEQKVRLELVPQ